MGTLQVVGGFPTSYGMRASGVLVTSNPPDDVIILHHPSGYWQHISYANQSDAPMGSPPVVSNNYSSPIYSPDNHWKARLHVSFRCWSIQMLPQPCRRIWTLGAERRMHNGCCDAGDLDQRHDVARLQWERFGKLRYGAGHGSTDRYAHQYRGVGRVVECISRCHPYLCAARHAPSLLCRCRRR